MSQNVRSILGQQAGVRNARVLKGPNLRNDPDFDLQVENAEAGGVITEDESDELLLLDLIISGTRTGTRERVYAGIEVSITANDDDVNGPPTGLKYSGRWPESRSWPRSSPTGWRHRRENWRLRKRLRWRSIPSRGCVPSANTTHLASPVASVSSNSRITTGGGSGGPNFATYRLRAKFTRARALQGVEY